MTVALLVAVSVAGAAGALARYGVDAALRRRLPAARVPWATLVVNVTGSLLLGILVGSGTGPGADRGTAETVRVVAGTGFCGAYTTFSTAMVEVVRTWREPAPLRAAAYATGTLLATVVAASAGMAIGMAIGMAVGTAG